MIYINLLASHKEIAGLDGIVATMAEAIDARDVEERESSSYPSGRYFRAKAEQFLIEVSLADELGHDDLPYWIHLKSSELNEEEAAIKVNELVHELLIPAGFRVALLENFGKINERRRDY